MTATATQTNVIKVKSLLSRLEDPMFNFQVLFGATLILLIGGVTMVISASSVFSFETYGNSWALAERQFIFAIFGVFCMWRVSFWSPRATRKWCVLLLVGSIGALVLVLLIGTSVNGQRNWLEFGPLRLQPSELAKLAVILWAAHMLTFKQAHLKYARHLLIPIVPIFGLILLLILAEGDLGTAMVITPVMMAMFLFVGVPKRWLAGVSVVGLLGIVYYTYKAPYRAQRFTAWLHPDSDPSGIGFQLAHAKQAMGAGGWWGLGLGGSREKWGTLPEAHTDFIYAVIGEETGLLGTIAILGLFGAIAVIGFRIARRAPDPYVKLVAAGITTWITVQMLVNICAVLGVMPITGVPLPLVSYGGSSLVPTLVGLGILMSFARNEAALAAVE
jgi:cell division protein FtsW